MRRLLLRCHNKYKALRILLAGPFPQVPLIMVTSMEGCSLFAIKAAIAPQPEQPIITTLFVFTNLCSPYHLFVKLHVPVGQYDMSLSVLFSAEVLNVENNLVKSLLLQCLHTGCSLLLDKRSSVIFPHWLHLYSYNGIRLVPP